MPLNIEGFVSDQSHKCCNDLWTHSIYQILYHACFVVCDSFLLNRTATRNHVQYGRDGLNGVHALKHVVLGTQVEVDLV